MKEGQSHCALQNPWDVCAKTSSEKQAAADPSRVLGGDSYELGDSLGQAGRPPTGVARSPPALGSGSWRGLSAGLGGQQTFSAVTELCVVQDTPVAPVCQGVHEGRPLGSGGRLTPAAQPHSVLVPGPLAKDDQHSRLPHSGCGFRQGRGLPPAWARAGRTVRAGAPGAQDSQHAARPPLQGAAGSLGSVHPAAESRLPLAAAGFRGAETIGP